MRKYLSVFLILCMAFSLSACTPKAESETSKSSAASQAEPVKKPIQTEAPTPEPTPESLTVIADEKTNLLTGQETLSDKAYGKRPIAVMINNIKDCLPQYGISDADVIFEMLVEYNITRMMAVYADYSKIPEVCTVRSCRYYYPLIAAGYDARYLHCGFDNVYAMPLVEEMGLDNIDAGYDTLDIFRRDQERIDEGYAYEHTLYLDGPRLMEVLDSDESQRTDLEDKYKKTWFNFSTKEIVPNGDSCTDCTVNFSDEYYSDFTYNTETKTYYKTHSGDPHMDERSGTQLNFSNVIVLETYVGDIDETTKKQIDIVGTDKNGYYISEGKVQKIKWSKEDNFAPIVYKDLEGNDLMVNQGKTFVAVTNEDTFVINK